MPFNPLEYLEKLALPPGEYTAKLEEWRVGLDSAGKARYQLTFTIEGKEGFELTDWWSAGNQIAMTRAIQAAQIIKPALLKQIFKDEDDFFVAVLNALEKRPIRVLLKKSARPDGTPVNRIGAFLPPLEEAREEVPF